MPLNPPARAILFPLFLILLGCSTERSNDSSVGRPERSCRGEEFRQFDFWLGEWEITSASGAGTGATSKISLRQDGCVILEEYQAPSASFSGVSMNFYDRSAGSWRQTWIDNTGAAIYFTGGLLREGVMRMEDRSQPAYLKRATWSRLEDGRVHQHGERSTDGGKTWFTAFNGYYQEKN